MSVSPTHKAPRTGSPASPDPAPHPTARTSLQLPGGNQEPRRSSIQFLAHHPTHHRNASPSTGKPKPAAGPRQKRRISSPPPPPVFQPRVSFDTFDRTADNVEDNSFTLISKHKDYEYTKRSRTFLCGCDDNDYSEYALQWLIDELVDDGDEIVCLRVVEKIDGSAGEKNMEHKRYRNEANALMKQFQAKNHENKAINLILEFAVGKVNKVIDEMINLYEPAILVVGTRGRNLGGFQGLLPGSVSKYCLQSSPVPVIVVLPSSKRDKSRVKRAQDPSRQSYKELLEKSGPAGVSNMTTGDKASLLTPEGSRRPSGDETLLGVDIAAANKPVESSPLTQVHTAGSFEGARQSPETLMKSPELQNLESPETSDDSSSSSDDDDEDDSPHSGKEKAKETEDGVSETTLVSGGAAERAQARQAEKTSGAI